MLLHGYQSSSDKVERYFDLQPAAARGGFIYVRPNGTKDRSGDQFWNATDACCDMTGTGVDDSAYLAQLIADLKARYPVDPRRVYLIGHSNGGFMAYRMACDHADAIAAIVSLAGAMTADLRTCTPSTHVSVLEVHGTADDLIPYRGGSIRGHEFPAATVTVEDWARLDRCAARPRPRAALDVIGQPDIRFSAPPIAGADTSVLAYPRCAATTTVELWTIRGGGHIPGLTPRFTTEVIDFLLAHPKP
jgi:polyhydroxybutyrate depolymerase